MNITVEETSKAFEKQEATPDERPPDKAEMMGHTSDKREETRRQIAQNASFNTPYVVMNALATVVACYGLLQDSTAVVIGAMIIAMLLGPIAGIALALDDGDNHLLRRALVAEVGGAALSIWR